MRSDKAVKQDGDDSTSFEILDTSQVEVLVENTSSDE